MLLKRKIFINCTRHLLSLLHARYAFPKIPDPYRRYRVDDHLHTYLAVQFNFIKLECLLTLWASVSGSSTRELFGGPTPTPTPALLLLLINDNTLLQA